MPVPTWPRSDSPSLDPVTSKRWAERGDAEAFFAGAPVGLAVFDTVAAEVAACGGAELRVAPTRVGWARRRGFAFLWSASMWFGARGAPLVLTVTLPDRAESPRWKQVVEVRPGLWNHHLEVSDAAVVDAEVLAWVRAAYEAAG